MSEAWYAAFALLALLSIVNAFLLVAVMRQVGIIHERIPPRGPGAVGPQPGTMFEGLQWLDLSPEDVEHRDAPVSVIAYVTPGCELCGPVPGYLRAWRRAASAATRELVSVALVTDAGEHEVETLRHDGWSGLPILQHAGVRRHYGLEGSPYVLALTTGLDGERADRLLIGGITNTLEQLEDLIDVAVSRFLSLGEAPEARGPTEESADPESVRSTLSTATRSPLRPSESRKDRWNG